MCAKLKQKPGHVDTKGERVDGRNWEIGTDTYILLILCLKTDNK